MNGFLNHLAALLFVYRELLERDLELVVRLLYGSGLRLMEALRLRAKELDCERRELTVRRLRRADLAAGLVGW